MKADRRAPTLELRNVVKRFGDFSAVDGITVEIADGEFFTIVGPSGSGKTTLIRILAGMDEPSSGDILLDGRRINDVPANRRPTCMVFQTLALFPHRSVGENIEFSLKIRGVDKAQRRERALALLEQLRLPAAYYERSVQQCSGGERQRVALARALAFDPEILFFDEPLSSLDFRLRKTLEKELKDIHRETGKTFVYITHSLEEAMVMSDRIAIMKDGRFVQIGTPDVIYNQPRNRFVAQFMGEVNMVPIERHQVGRDDAGSDDVESDNGPRYRIRGSDHPVEIPDSATPTESAHLVIRPEVVRIGPPAAQSPNRLTGVLFNEYSLGSRVQYQVRVPGAGTWVVERLRDERYQGSLDDEVEIGWRPEDSIVVE